MVLSAILASLLLTASFHMREGAASSRVVVVIYEDLQCPDCADFHRMLHDKLLPRFGSAVTFEHHDFPLAKHAWARKAAIAARFFEAAKPGLGLEFRSYVFENQPSITASNFSERLAQFAESHGVDAAKANAALEDAALAAAVEADFQDGTGRGVAHTPTVLVNGQPFVEQFRYEDISKAIEASLAQK